MKSKSFELIFFLIVTQKRNQFKESSKTSLFEEKNEKKRKNRKQKKRIQVKLKLWIKRNEIRQRNSVLEIRSNFERITRLVLSISKKKLETRHKNILYLSSNVFNLLKNKRANFIYLFKKNVELCPINWMPTCSV